MLSFRNENQLSLGDDAVSAQLWHPDSLDSTGSINVETINTKWYREIVSEHKLHQKVDQIHIEKVNVIRSIHNKAQ